MKRLILSCVVMLMAMVTSFAQTTPPPDVATPVSKSEYVSKVTALNNAILATNMTLAETIFGQVNTLITDEMKVMRYKLRDAATEAEKTAHRNVIKDQRMYFSHVMTHKQNGMAPNRAQLMEALNNFGNTFD